MGCRQCICAMQSGRYLCTSHHLVQFFTDAFAADFDPESVLKSIFSDALFTGPVNPCT